LNLEAAKAVKYGGTTPEEALKFVTLNPAKQLKIDNRVGSLEEGKDADFVVWNGDPLSTLTICEQTWIDGRKYFDRTEDRAMTEEVKSQRAALIQKILAGGDEGGGDKKSAARTKTSEEKQPYSCRHEHEESR
jgi:adenine deaminase